MTTAKDVIRLTIGSADMMIQAFLSDMSDDDLLVAPLPGMNPIAWQLGHMIAAERHWTEMLRPGSSPALPEGFAEAHSEATGAPNSFRPVHAKAEYLAVWEAQRAATLAVLDALPDESLGAESGVLYAPTVAALFNMVGAHALEHAGQFVAVRRKLGKPVVI